MTRVAQPVIRLVEKQPGSPDECIHPTPPPEDHPRDAQIPPARPAKTGASRRHGGAGSCGTELPLNFKFCNECGAPVTQLRRSAEYKQVTVLFADVVRSMDIAAAVGAERLREIMTDLVNRAAVVVQPYGGTVNQFTGEGIMAVFGAPVALEDHAVRACLTALGVQEDAQQLAADVQDRDGVELQLRIGLNSGQVIAGEIGSGPFGYTAVGEQVGMAQRMESVAPPGGVMLGASTARLVEEAATLGDPELVQIKGADAPVPAYRLLGIGDPGVLSRVWSVGGGRCPPLKVCWTAQSTSTVLWSAWSGHLGLVKAVWCARWQRWQVAAVGGVHHLLRVAHHLRLRVGSARLASPFVNIPTVTAHRDRPFLQVGAQVVPSPRRDHPP